MELGNRFDKILSEIYLVDNIVYLIVTSAWLESIYLYVYSTSVHIYRIHSIGILQTIILKKRLVVVQSSRQTETEHTHMCGLCFSYAINGFPCALRKRSYHLPETIYFSERCWVELYFVYSEECLYVFLCVKMRCLRMCFLFQEVTLFLFIIP